jgi:PP-loop superfamily ATP-utilizing enzyme
VVALSGGSGSALVAYLLASVFEDSTVACIGVSPSLPEAQLQRARYTADALGARGAPTFRLHACMHACGGS